MTETGRTEHRDRDKDRVVWIDDVKGIGIILVVIGHTYEAYQGSNYGPIYLFHMPLFFFMSGMVFRPAPLRSYLWRRVQTLLVPYFAFLTLLVVAKLGISLVHGPSLQAVLASEALLATSYLYGGRSLTGDNGIAWFITCLFVALLIYDGLRRTLGSPLTFRFVAVMAGVLAGAYWLGPLASPWDVAVVPMAMVFVWAGEVWASLPAVGALPKAARWRPDGAATTAVALGLAVVGLLFARPFDMKYGDYGTPILSVLAALGCIHIVVVACRRLSRLPLFNAILAPIGRASLVIFFLHRFIVFHLRDDLAEPLAFAVALAVPLGGYYILARLRTPRLLRQLFLGEGPSHLSHKAI